MKKIKVKTLHQDKPNSCEFFNSHWLCWKILGISVKIPEHHKRNYIFYSLIINAMVTIWYPLHLTIQLFLSDTPADYIKNLAITVTCIACSIKFLIYSTKMPIIIKFEQILQQLDERINDGLELEYFRQFKRRVRIIALAFVCIYTPIGVTAELSFIFRDERRLLYPGWFPFNWFESPWKFYVANIYQILGISLLILQNFTNDCFPAIALCMLSGHIKILSARVGNIGYDMKSLEENEKELNRCVVDQINLYDLYTVSLNIISFPMFIQFCVTATNICLAVAAILFFVTTPMDLIYYCVYLFGMPLQIFPTCFYGSDFQYLFDQLHRAPYASNWTAQSAKYKKHMILFTERSLKEHVAMAGGILRIDLDTFFSTCRGAYSLFAIIGRVK